MPDEGQRPRRPVGVERVRELQRSLYMAAKSSPTRRFHALYDRIFRSDVLGEAWERARANGGAAGVDRVTFDDIERRGVAVFIAEIANDLKTGTYRPQPVRRRYIPKADGKQRPLGIPTIRDRVVQMATKIVLEPIFEADFADCSYGFRPKRDTTQALTEIWKEANRGKRVVVDGDIKAYFDTIDHDRLMDRVGLRVSDRRVLKLIRQWLTAGVMEEGEVKAATLGSPQGGVISPLLANIYLHYL